MTVVAILFGVACWMLGSWQWSRHVEQRTKVMAIEQNYEADPVPIATVLAHGVGGRRQGAGLTAEQQWSRVTLQGSYRPGPDLMVRNRTKDQTVGFEVLTPFVTDGLTILVDRDGCPMPRRPRAPPRLTHPHRRARSRWSAGSGVVSPTWAATYRPPSWRASASRTPGRVSPS